MKNQRFDQLMEGYRQDKLSYEEYAEFLKLLDTQGAEDDLDEILTLYWQKGKQSSPGIGFMNRGKTGEFKRTNFAKWSVAASILIAIGILVFLSIGSPLNVPSYVIYRTGFGERLEVVLDDGSRVELNANSELKWTEGWKNTQLRQIELKGEAFFDVKRQKGIPFFVATDDVEVEVLGTSFNVDSRKDKTEIYLDEGKVRLKLKDTKVAKAVVEKELIIMNPGDQIQYLVKEKKIVRSEGESVMTAAAWKNDVLNFKNMKFGDVLMQLRDIYGQSFECNSTELLSTPIYLGVPYADWDGVRNALELSLGIQFDLKSPQTYEVRKIKK